MPRCLCLLASTLFACRSSTATPNAPRGFDDLAITISAHQHPGADVSVLVQLAHPARLGRAACFVAPADLRITVDGQLLQITDPGGPARASRISGVEVPDPIGCRPALARSVARLEPRPASSIVVEHGGRRGEVIAPNLLGKRAVRVVPGTTVSPGDRVSLEWTDRDRWIGDHLATSLVLYSPDEFSLSLELEIEPPRFSFVVPQVRPGKAQLTLYPGNLRLAVPARCSGFRACDVRPNDHHDPLELTIR